MPQQRSTRPTMAEQTYFSCMKQKVLAVQGAYYLATGVWGLVNLRTFMLVTGPKTDTWLVKSVSVLVGFIGLGLIVHAKRAEPAREVQLIAGGCAGGLAAIDAYYVARQRI